MVQARSAVVTAVIFSILLIAGSAKAATTTADPMCGWSQVSMVSSGVTYNILTDSFGGHAECLRYSHTRPAFKVVSSFTGGPGPVQAYPHIAVVSKALPIRVSAMRHQSFTWYAYTNAAPGLYNTSIDMWVTKGAASRKSDIKAELMVWFNNTVSYSYKNKPVVNVDGRAWYVTHWGKSVPGDRTYVQFRLVHPLNKVHVSYMGLTPFYRAAEHLHLIKGWWYMQSLEAGNEIWSNGTGLQTTLFRSHL
jgi:hypothetical protein